jgi:hypothetical protein
VICLGSSIRLEKVPRNPGKAASIDGEIRVRDKGYRRIRSAVWGAAA